MRSVVVTDVYRRDLGESDGRVTSVHALCDKISNFYYARKVARAVLYYTGG